MYIYVYILYIYVYISSIPRTGPRHVTVVAKMLQSFSSYMRWARCTMRFNSVAP